jgi:hypothetical protein
LASTPRIMRASSNDMVFRANMDAAPPLAASCATPERCASVKGRGAGRREGGGQYGERGGGRGGAEGETGRGRVEGESRGSAEREAIARGARTDEGLLVSRGGRPQQHLAAGHDEVRYQP